jgi:hypothetical protein
MRLLYSRQVLLPVPLLSIFLLLFPLGVCLIRQYLQLISHLLLLPLLRGDSIHLIIFENMSQMLDVIVEPYIFKVPLKLLRKLLFFNRRQLL